MIKEKEKKEKKLITILIDINHKIIINRVFIDQSFNIINTTFSLIN